MAQEKGIPAVDSWLERFSIQDEDIEYLYEFLLEREKPLTTGELAYALIEKRSQDEKKKLEALLKEGNVYRPSEAYEVGRELVFPAFDFARGEVVGVRPGYNPEYGEFEVIKVRLDTGEEREFASRLPMPHKLDLEDPSDWLDRSGVNPGQLAERYGEAVEAALVERLAQEDEFVRFGDFWLLKGMLPDINLGHLNLAEAVIDVAGKPLPPEEILPALDLPDTHPKEVKVFALNVALSGDERFSQVGPVGQTLWFLRRLEPEEVAQTPERLLYEPIPWAPEALSPELLEVIRGIDDEANEESLFAPDSLLPDEPVTIALPYHHYRCGTLPLTPRLRGIFPQGSSDHTVVEFLDEVKGERFFGWVVHSGKYVAGLREWFEKIGASVGAYITLSKGRKPGEVRLRYTPHRIRKEWVRAARVQNERLYFEMRMHSIGCDYDDLMMIAEIDRDKIDALWQKLRANPKPLYDLLVQIVPDLAKLSPQGTVHSRTVYTAVNLIFRCPPGPILAELERRDCFTYVGNGYWVFDESKL